MRMRRMINGCDQQLIKDGYHIHDGYNNDDKFDDNHEDYSEIMIVNITLDCNILHSLTSITT